MDGETLRQSTRRAAPAPNGTKGGQVVILIVEVLPSYPARGLPITLTALIGWVF